MLRAALLAGFLEITLAAYQETKCANVGGTCKAESACSGRTLAGYCPTQPKSIKCCVTSEGPYQEQKCADVGGICKAESACSGRTLTGYCPTQPESIRCCVTSEGPYQEQKCANAGGTCKAESACSGLTLADYCPTQPTSISRFVFDEETASVHLSSGLPADCVRLSFRLFCCESDFLSKQVECFLENGGPYYGQTQHVFTNGTVRSKAENAKLLGKSSVNTYIYEVVEIMTSGAGYLVLRIRPSSGSDVVTVQPPTGETFLDAYLEDGPSLVILVVPNGGLWIRRYRWRGAVTSTEEVTRLGEHDPCAEYLVCATQAYFGLVSSTVEPRDLGYAAVNLQIEVHHRQSERVFEIGQSILADSERLQLGCGRDTVDLFFVKNEQIRHLVVLLPTTIGRPSVGIPSRCHCGICLCGISTHKYSYPERPYNDKGVNPYDAPDACKGYWSYEPSALDDASLDGAKKWTTKQEEEAGSGSPD